MERKYIEQQLKEVLDRMDALEEENVRLKEGAPVERAGYVYVLEQVDYYARQYRSLTAMGIHAGPKLAEIVRGLEDAFQQVDYLKESSPATRQTYDEYMTEILKRAYPTEEGHDGG